MPPRGIRGSGTATFDRAPGSGFPVEGQSSSGVIFFKELRTGRYLIISISGSPYMPLGSDHPRDFLVPIKVAHAENAHGKCRAGAEGTLQVRGGTFKPPNPDEVILSIADCGLREGYDEGHAGTHLDLHLDPDKKTAVPWKVDFDFTVSTPGARLPAKPEPPHVFFTWRMGPRYASGLHGLPVWPSTPESINPPEWKVDFTASTTGEGSGPYHWVVDGAPYTTKGDHLHTVVHRLGPIQASVEWSGAREDKQITLRHRLVLGIGDSLASGEGNPDGPITKQRKEPIWQDRQCHRSSLSHQSMTAFGLAREDPHSSVTFVHLACSGAAFASGLFGPYTGIEPAFGEMLAGQLYQYGQISGGRRPDVVLLSIGVNHAHFGAVLKYCAVVFQSVRRNCRDSNVVFDENAGSFVSDSSGPTLADYVAARLAELPAEYEELDRELSGLGVKPERVYIDLYPDPTRERDGRTICDHFLFAGPKGVASIDPEDTRWLAHSFALPLNLAILRAAKLYRWNVVRGYANAFYEHGYCAGEHRWIETVADSEHDQGNKDGAVHPNETGQKVISKYELKAVLDDLNP